MLSAFPLLRKKAAQECFGRGRLLKVSISYRFVSGHDFHQVAENSLAGSFVSGHGFSPAATR